MYSISYVDIIVTPIVIFIVILLSKVLSKSLCKNPQIKKYYLPSLYLKIICTFLTFILYAYYYGYGDTFEYYKGGETVKLAFINGDFGVGFELLFQNYNNFSPSTLKYIGDQWYFEGDSTRAIVGFSAFFSFFAFSSFLSISILFTFLSFIGSWLIFVGLNEYTKSSINSLAYASLFVPSYLFWGTGIMKEPICIFALGCSYYTMQKLIINKVFKIRYLFFTVICFLLLFLIKVYILISFLIAFILFVVKEYSQQFKYLRFSLVFKFFIVLFICLIIYQTWKLVSSYSQGFSSLEAILEQIDYTQSAQIINSEGGSGYDLGTITLTPSGILNYALLAINVTLFRPYPWEISKIVNIPTSLESLCMFFFLIQTIVKAGIKNFIKIIIRNPIILFCLIFTLVISIMIGVISFNFGTLTRYRIPMLPFYFTALLLIQHYTITLENNKL